MTTQGQTQRKIISEEVAAHAFMNQMSHNMTKSFPKMIQQIQDKWSPDKELNFPFIKAADEFLAMDITLGLITLKNYYSQQHMQSLINNVMMISENLYRSMQKRNPHHQSLPDLIQYHYKRFEDMTKTSTHNPIEQCAKITTQNLGLAEHKSSTEIELFIFVHFTGVEVWKGMEALFKITFADSAK